MRLIRLITLLCMCGPAMADALLFDAYTYHPRSQPWMQNKTPGVQWIGDSGLTIGAFCNSYSASTMHPEQPGTGRRNCQQTFDAGWTFGGRRPIDYGLMTAGAVGYDRGVRIGGVYVMPIIAPFIRLGPVQLMLLAPRTYHLGIRADLP